MNATKEQILATGLRLWHECGEIVTARRIAKELNKVHSVVLYHFPNNSLRDGIAEYAVAKKDAKMIVHLIGISHPSVKELTDAERVDYLRRATN